MSGTVTTPRRPRDRGPWLPWLCCALLLLGTAVIIQMLLDRGERAIELTSFLVVITLAPLLRHVRTAAVAGITLTGVVAVALAGAAVLYVSTLRWMTSWDDVDRLRSLASLETSVTGKEQFELAAFRRWSLTAPSTGQQLRVDVDVIAVPPLVAWQSGPTPVAISASAEDGAVLHFEARNQFAFRSASLAEPLAHRHFRASLHGRAAVGGSASCGYLYLGEHGARATNRSRVCLDETWTAHAVDWQAPADSHAGLLDVIVSGFDEPIAVRDVIIVEHTDIGTTPIGDLVPTGITLRASWDQPFPWSRTARQERFVTVVPGELGSFSLVLPLPDGLPSGTDVWSTMHVETGAAVRILGTSWAAPGIRPASTGQRLTLGFDHPNLLAHAVAALAVTAIGTLRWGRTLLLVMASAGGVIALTGSRTAFVALLLSTLVLILARPSLRRSARVLAGIAVVASVGLTATVLLTQGSRVPTIIPRVVALDERSLLERVDIWAHAVRLSRHEILTGTSSSFATTWEERHPGRAPVLHAHNGVLDMLVRYGLVGATGALAGLTAIVLMAGISNRRRTAAAVACLVTLNAFDATYASLLTLLPLMALALSRDGARQPIQPDAPHGALEHLDVQGAPTR